MLLSPSDISLQKSQLRLEMKAHRALLSEAERARASWLACDSLSRWLRNRPETRIAVFLARPVEINLDALINELLCQNRIVCAPRVELASETMKFWQLPALDATTRGPWSVREPISKREIQPDLVIVPGLAFDPNGGRMGTGGGWYDRVLADIPTKIGVAFDSQIVENVPVESHDIAMDWVASERQLARCRQKNAAIS